MRPLTKPVKLNAHECIKTYIKTESSFAKTFHENLILFEFSNFGTVEKNAGYTSIWCQP